jgi:acyl-CoA synthetase (AMP-forming)/AMP-acid ligase II
MKSAVLAKDKRSTIEGELGRRLLLGETIVRNVRKYPDKEALVYGKTRLTYRQFNSRINRLAHALLDIGVKKGTKAAILSFNCHQFLEAYYALGKIGGVSVPLNFRLHGEELVYMINHSDAEALIAGGAFIESVKGMKRDLPQVKHYISITEKPIRGMRHYETWIAKYPDDEPLVLVDEEDPVFIMYTAGTTGRPKGAVITHKNEVVMWMLGGWYAFTEPNLFNNYSLREFRILAAPPIFHLAAFGFCQFSFFGGTTLILPEEVFDPVNIMRTIQEEKVNAILMIPAMANFLFLLPDLDKYDTRSLQIWLSGGAILPTETRRLIQKQFPSVRILDLFGQTEMSPLVTGLLPSESRGRETSVGRVLPFIEMRVVDDNDKDVPIGEVGEAVYRGPTVLKEYYKDPKATAEAMRGGWFHSGDLVRSDAEGYIYVVDRKKDMIISGGENIYPAEIEEVLCRHPKIMECAVIGVIDEKWGESVKAVVVCKPGEQLTVQEVIEYCKLHLASYKKPRSVDFVDSLPRSSIGKVLKRALREQYGKSVKY